MGRVPGRPDGLAEQGILNIYLFLSYIYAAIYYYVEGPTAGNGILHDEGRRVKREERI